jgi:putative radical SAM enzyme (TIGR03279 family)
MSGGTVAAVSPGSVGEALGILPGDVLLEINGHPLRDVLDVQFYAADEELALLVRRGERETLYEVERAYGIPLGLDFGRPTFDGMRHCGNRCDFCFVAQMPPGMRRSLYVRDDDYRYSVLYGAFITLTNLTEADWARLEEQRLSPLYVSVHATEPALRRQLLGREDIPDILPQLDRLVELGIEIHAQIVLTPGLNDGAHLLRTLEDLVARRPAIASIGVVPVGLTRYHRGVCRRYTPAEARSVIEQVAPLQEALRAAHGCTLVYLSDEWYLLGGEPVPADAWYDDYPQIENGVGLVRQFLDDLSALTPTQNWAQAPTRGKARVARCTLACGTLIAQTLAQAAGDVSARSGVEMTVVPVANHTFGETVTVSGLLGGRDVLRALEGRALGEIVFVPDAMLAQYTPGAGRADGARVTLDDLSLSDMEAQLGVRVLAAGTMSDVWRALVRAPRARAIRRGKRS